MVGELEEVIWKEKLIFFEEVEKTESLDDCYHRTYTNNENEYIVIVVLRLLLLLRGY
jgi:hypothetical protein